MIPNTAQRHLDVLHDSAPYDAKQVMIGGRPATLAMHRDGHASVNFAKTDTPGMQSAYFVMGRDDVSPSMYANPKYTDMIFTLHPSTGVVPSHPIEKSALDRLSKDVDTTYATLSTAVASRIKEEMRPKPPPSTGGWPSSTLTTTADGWVMPPTSTSTNGWGRGSSPEATNGLNFRSLMTALQSV